MNLTDRHWLWLAAACYLAGFALGTAGLARKRLHSRAGMYLIVALGYAVQTYGLYLRGVAVKGCPLGNTFELFQFTAWSAASLYLVIGATFRLSLLGYCTAMLATALTTLSLACKSWDGAARVHPFGDNPWIEFHAALAVFSYGVFGLQALTAAMLMLRNYSLKSKRVGGSFSFLPSVYDLDHISVRLLAAGVALLAASLAVGAAWWLRDTASVHLGKILVTCAVWVAYALALALRWRGLLLARRYAWTCIALFAAALLSLGTVNPGHPPTPPPGARAP